MEWKKKGVIFFPDGQYNWSQTHAQAPTVLVLNDRFRIFFATRNQDNKSQIALIDIDIDNPQKILHIHSEPVFSFGKPGTFDDEGVMPSFVGQYNNQLWMYYSGWNQRNTVPYHNAIGIAVSNNEGFTFERISDGPIMDRSFEEPYIAITPYIVKENNLWRMWYSSGLQWKMINGHFEHIYAIKYAESINGIDWKRYKKNIIKQSHSLEVLCRPCVVKINNHYHLWYSYRDSLDFRNGTGAYKMGYAISKNGDEWLRNDEKSGLNPSEKGWDSKMICYPYVVKAKNNHFLFYNGNDFGKSGIGYAILNETNT